MFLLFLLGLNILGAASQRVTNKVFFDITIGGQSAGRIVFGLFGDKTPKTVANFIGLATGDNNDDLTYKGTQIFRIIPGFMAQGGDVLTDTGTHSKSIYGNKFADENFDVKFTKKYQLAMANTGKDTNGSQFMITLKKLYWLDNKHMVFGEVMEGQDVVDAIENVGTWGTSGKPKRKVVIADCGELPMTEVAVASNSADSERAVGAMKGTVVCDTKGCHLVYNADSERAVGAMKGTVVCDTKGCHLVYNADSERAVGAMKGTVVCDTKGCHLVYNAEAYTQEFEALAYTGEVHGASPFSLVNVFAAVGFAFTAYGAFRHYVK